MLTREIDRDKLLKRDEEREMLGFMSLLIISFLNVNVQVLNGGVGVVIKYIVNVDRPVWRIVCYYSPDGRDFYPVGYKINYGNENPFSGKFYWVFPGGRWEGGYIKVVSGGPSGIVEEKIIDGRDLEVILSTSGEYGTYSTVSMSNHTFKGDRINLGDPYAWRMLGYDAQHTGYYPYPLYPPLELKWTYTGEGADFMMLSGCAGNGMLYMPGGTIDENGWRLAQILAMDIESGEIVWKKTLTSNVWSAALSQGDSLLFVGTSIEPSLTQPTFFCLDARTGEILWSKFLYTVGSGLLPVDSFIYVQSVQGFLYAFNLEGEEIWMDTVVSPWVGTGRHPAYYNGKIYIGGENSALLALDAFTGDTLWVFPTPGWIVTDPLVFNDKIYFASQPPGEGILYCIDAEEGNLYWSIENLPATSPYKLSAFEDKIFMTLAYWGDSVPVLSDVYALDVGSGNYLWTTTIGGEIAITSMPLTSNEVIWTANEYIRALNTSSGALVYKSLEIPGTYSWPSHYWPIIYRDYLIGAHRTMVYVYKGGGGYGTYPLSCYPNPFRDFVTISLNIEGEVLVKIYDKRGSLVKNLFRGYSLGEGFKVIWDGRDFNDRKIPSGVYFVVLRGKEMRVSQKVVYLKGG